MSIDTTTTTESVAIYDAPLTDTMYLVLWCIGLISSALSLYGSGSIMFISQNKIRRKHSIYHRLLFIVSCIDFCIILYIPWSPLLMDTETGLKLAMGNQATCTSVGVLSMFSVISKSFYSCYIACYFMLSVRYNISDQILIRYEIYAYLFALLVPIGYTIVGVIDEAFNPNEFRYCAISKHPVGCTGNECVRGQLAPLLSTIATITSLLLSLIGIICTVLLFMYVRTQTKKTLRHDYIIGQSALNTNQVPEQQQQQQQQQQQRTPSRKESIIHRQQQQRSKLVRTQSILYVTANMNNFIWLFIFNRLVLNSVNSDNVHEKDTMIFISGLLCFLFMPAYGFYNFCIYCYPRWKRLKSHCPNKSFWWYLRIMYSKDEGESEIQASRRAKQLKQSQCSTNSSCNDLLSLSLSSGGISNIGSDTPDQKQPSLPSTKDSASLQNSVDAMNTLNNENNVGQDPSMDFQMDSTDLLVEEIRMMDDIETAEDSTNKLYVDF